MRGVARRAHGGLVVAMLGAAFAANGVPACGGSPGIAATSGSGGRTERVCTPFAALPCLCAGGAEGQQVCAPDGSGLGACMGCYYPPDGGPASSSSGAGGASSSSGAGGGGNGGSEGSGGSGGTGGHAPPPCPISGPLAGPHRPAATPCPPTTTATGCTTDADCMGPFTQGGKCTASMTCSYDQCTTDADCGGGVCTCSPGGTPFNYNMCLPAGCHVDADCGPGGLCSPNLWPGPHGCAIDPPTGWVCQTCQDSCAANCAWSPDTFALTCYYQQGQWTCALGC